MKSLAKTKTIVYRFDDVAVDAADFRLEKSGSFQKITPRAFEVLVYLLENAGRTVEKQELFEQIWRESFVTDNALTRIIKEIRQVIGDDAASPRYIETVPKRGYRFIAEVTQSIKQAQSDENEIPATEARIENTAVAERSIEEQASAALSPTVRKTRNSKTGLIVLFSAIALLFIGIGAFGLASYIRFAKPDAPVVQQNQQATSWSGLDTYPAISPDGSSIAYSSDKSGRFEVYVKPFAAGAREIQITSDGQQNFQPAWSPDGRRLAYHSKGRGGIWIVPASGGVAKQLTDFGSRPAWSPDGSLISFQSGALTDLGINSRALSPSVLWLAPTDGGAPKPLTQIGNPAGGHGSPAWSPDGKRLAFVVGDVTSIDIWSIAVGGDDLRPVRQRAADPAYAADGRGIYFTSFDGLCFIPVSPETNEITGQQTVLISAGPSLPRFPSISSSGKQMVYSMLKSSSNLTSVALDSKSGIAVGEPAPLNQNTAMRNTFPAFSPDGGRLAFNTSRAGGYGELWVLDGDNLTQVSEMGNFSSWFPDGARLGFMSLRERNTYREVNLKTGKETKLFGFSADADVPRLSPDGRFVVYNSKKSGSINVWLANLENGREEQLVFDNEFSGFPHWSPDGKLIGFQLKRGDDMQVAVMPREGGEISVLTREPGQSWGHSFSPDGERIAFAGQRNDIWNIYWVSRTTKEQKQLTNYNKLNTYVRYPAWSPAGDKIVYEFAETTGNIWLTELK